MARYRSFFTFAAVIAMTTGVMACGRRVPDSAARVAIHAAITDPSLEADREISAAVKQWYAARGYTLAWEAERDVDAAVKVLTSAASHGLNAESYGGSRLKTLREERLHSKARDAERARLFATFDVAMTTALMHAGRDVSVGRIRPASLDTHWERARKLPDLAGTLAAATDGGTLATWLDDIAPRHREYGQLRAWLAELRQKPDGGASDPHVAQIAANLERMRWLPDDLGDRHLVVNIPEFMLRAREHDRTVLEMRVVVGKADGHETPVLSGELESVVFNPYWNIPDSILLAETLPAMEKDPDYLERHDMEVVRVSAKGAATVPAEDVDWGDRDALKELRIRQRPGDDNALGKIKFPFRNRQAIYLHDTPSTALFARESRAFSHGCVRVAHPEALASYVLSGNPEWTTERVSTAAKGTEEQHVNVAADLPVHIVYFTVVAGPDGHARYLEDVYGYDRKQASME